MFDDNDRDTHKTHADLVDLIGELKFAFLKDVLAGDIGRGQKRSWLDFPGRIWSDSKIITFWKYPSLFGFKKVLDGLKKNGFKVDETWQVEVHPKGGGLSLLIPIEKYSGEFFDPNIKPIKSDNADEVHRLPPDKKSKELKDRGVTPGYLKLKLPKDMTFAQYHSLMKQESTDEK